MMSENLELPPLPDRYSVTLRRHRVRNNTPPDVALKILELGVEPRKFHIAGSRCMLGLDLARDVCVQALTEQFIRDLERIAPFNSISIELRQAPDGEERKA